jgi:hypothetical protein
MSRQQHNPPSSSSSPSKTSSPGDSPVLPGAQTAGSAPSSSSNGEPPPAATPGQNQRPDAHPRLSSRDTRAPSTHPYSRVTTPATEGYPSWLPRRAPAPEPASTMHTHSSSTRAGPHSPYPYTPDADADADAGLDPEAEAEAEAGPSTGPGTASEPPTLGFSGRRPTPRSVRVVRMSASGRARVPTDTTRVGGGAPHPRVWSKATSAGFSPTAFSATPQPHLPRPRFRAPALHLDLLRNPSLLARAQFWLWPVWVFAHVPLQTFFDFNAVFILIE